MKRTKIIFDADESQIMVYAEKTLTLDKISENFVILTIDNVPYKVGKGDKITLRAEGRVSLSGD